MKLILEMLADAVTEESDSAGSLSGNSSIQKADGFNSDFLDHLATV